MDDHKIKTLIVDDEKIVRDFLTRLLSLEEVEIESAEDGYKAVELSRKKKFDIVFLDVRMPGMDGLQTLRELKKINPDAKYVMMTGYALDNVLKTAEKECMSFSIKKPFDISQILGFIKGHTREKCAKNTIKILVVDDDNIILNFFKKLLKDYEVTTVDNGETALELVKKQDYDLVFLDIVLKDANGKEIYSKIRKIKPHLYVMLMTGFQGEQKNIKELDVRGCLLKPFEIDKIFSEIEKVKNIKNIGVK